MEIWERIKEIKRIRGLTTLRISELTGSSTRYVSDVISGRAGDPRGSFLKQVVLTLDISPCWLLTGEGPMERHRCYHIPVLSMEDFLRYNPKKEIPVSMAHSGSHPKDMVLTVPVWLQEYSTDLRAVRVFHDMLCPTLGAGDLAILQATGWTGDGIYLYRQTKELFLSYLHLSDRGYHTSYKLGAQGIDAHGDIEPLGAVKCVVRRVDPPPVS